jgi:hypothetical protein
VFGAGRVTAGRKGARSPAIRPGAVARVWLRPRDRPLWPGPSQRSRPHPVTDGSARFAPNAGDSECDLARPRSPGAGSVDGPGATIEASAGTSTGGDSAVSTKLPIRLTVHLLDEDAPRPGKVHAVFADEAGQAHRA